MTTHSPILPDHIPDDSLYICQRANGSTRIEPFRSWGPLGRQGGIERGLDEADEEELTVSQRLLRGDFDA